MCGKTITNARGDQTTPSSVSFSDNECLTYDMYVIYLFSSPNPFFQFLRFPFKVLSKAGKVMSASVATREISFQGDIFVTNSLIRFLKTEAYLRP